MASRKSIGAEHTIVIGGNTYKRSFIRFTKSLCYFVAFMSFLMIPVAPFMLILSVFFGFVGFKYNKALKASKSAHISKEIQTSQNDLSSSSALDSLFGASVDTPRSETSSFKNTKINGLSFNVAGVTMTNDSKQNIQGIIKRAVKEIKERLDKDDLYEGKSNKEIAEDGEGNPDYKVFELDYETIDDVYLELEPTNQYDPNAIKVISEEFGHIGYVPKKMTKKVKELMTSEKHSVSCTITGGKYKYYDEDEEKVLIDSWDYGLEIEVE